jgi:NAD(P)-dependent dehydrogenase (short-subunit alcohol dehydrogenase family)
MCRTPLKKVATTADVARQVVVLASPTISGHVTGQNVVVAGGMDGRVLNSPTEVKVGEDTKAQ